MNIADRFYDLALDDGQHVLGRVDTLTHLTLLALANQLMRDRHQREALQIFKFQHEKYHAH